MGSTQRKRLWSGKAKVVAALGALIALGATATALGATTAQAGKVIIEIEGKLSPTKLSKTKPTPITLTVSGAIKDTEGEGVRPPALSTLDLEFDKHGTIYTKGLPTCSPSKLQATTTAAALKACGKELVGKGEVSAEIALPEQPPFSASGPLLIFNGPPKGGKPDLVMQVYAHVPAATTFVTEGVIGKGHGPYGTSTLIKIPTIVSGQGSLTSFSAKIHKTWNYKGEKKSLLYATCPSGHLVAHGAFNFVEGTSISGNLDKPCTS